MLTWASADTTVAAVDPRSGAVTARGPGATVLSVAGTRHAGAVGTVAVTVR